MLQDDQPIAIVVMGPSGTGKTTTARMLSERLGWPYAEADAFHPQANIAKMSSGVPLDDDDRMPWLEAIRDHIEQETRAGRSLIVTCSALKRRYRNVLRQAGARVRFVNLTADTDLIATRMAGRTGHFMPPALLQSQFDTLEPLGADEDGLTVSVLAPPEEVVADALRKLGIGETLQEN